MGPLTMAAMGLLFIAVLITSLSGNKGSGWACLAFLVSLAGAQAATYFGSINILSPFLVIAALLVFKWKHWIAYAICGLYAVRLAWIGVYGFTPLPAAQFWEYNNLYMIPIQALLGIYGGVINGGFKHLPQSIRASFGMGDSRITASDRSNKGD